MTVGMGKVSAGQIGAASTGDAYGQGAAKWAQEQAKRQAAPKASEGAAVQEQAKTGAVKVTPQQASVVRKAAARRLWGRIVEGAKQAAPYLGAAAAAGVVYMMVED